jgi:hypothetical protein
MTNEHLVEIPENPNIDCRRGSHADKCFTSDSNLDYEEAI